MQAWLKACVKKMSSSLWMEWRPGQKQASSYLRPNRASPHRRAINPYLRRSRRQPMPSGGRNRIYGKNSQQM